MPADLVGEIWVHGENVAEGYWHKPPEERACFGATLTDPSPGTPDGPWLRTGDLGFIHKGKVFIVGRIKDLLIIRGRNHYPEDIEATVQQIAQGRVAAISVPVDSTEQLVTVIEVKKKRGEANEDLRHRLSDVKSHVTSAISNAHGLNVGDMVLVRPAQSPSPRAAKSAAQPASSNTATINSPAWTPSPFEGRTTTIKLMLATVLIMALAVSVEPFRIGMTVLMLNGRDPHGSYSHFCAVVSPWERRWA